VDVLLQLAQADRSVLRELSARFDVAAALKKCDLPAAEVLAWCSAMVANDRVGFIAREPLQSLQDHFKAAKDR
jgi:hypothetical protein